MKTHSAENVILTPVLTGTTANEWTPPNTHILKALFSLTLEPVQKHLAGTHFKDACGTFPDYLSFHFYFLPSPGHGDSGGLTRKVFIYWGTGEDKHKSTPRRRLPPGTGCSTLHRLSCCGLYLTLWVVCWNLFVNITKSKKGGKFFTDLYCPPSVC